MLGADSTTTFYLQSPGSAVPLPHYFNYAQKVFEISHAPETDTLALVTWGLGGLGELSYRTLVGRLADDLVTNPAQTIKDVADRWAAAIWKEWNAAYKAELARVQLLHVNRRTPDEEREYARLLGLGVGFCLAGYREKDVRKVGAYEILFDPRTPMATPPAPQRLPIGNIAFWGVPNMIKRLLLGIDERLKNDILKSPQWKGTSADLEKFAAQYVLQPALMPIRDAIDFVHAGIYSTIKALKFSNLTQICGGPIEIAVITSDRKFRWVRHKRFDEAIFEQEGGA